jgi:hypothetical protein
VPPDGFTHHAPEPMIRELEGERFYAVPGVGTLPSVSTILRATAGRQWALETWRRNLGDEAADLVADIARRRGRALHRKVDRFLTTGERPTGAASDVWWRSIRPTVEHVAAIGRVVLSESAVWNELDGYAGTPDDLVAILGDLHVFDYKTAAERLDRVRLELYGEQLAGYADAISVMYGERPRDATLVIALPDGPAQVVHIDLECALERWRNRVRAFRAQRSD